MNTREINSYITEGLRAGKHRMEIFNDLLSRGASRETVIARIRKYPDLTQLSIIRVSHWVLIGILVLPCLGILYSMINGDSGRFGKQWPLAFYCLLLYGACKHWRGAYIALLVFFGLGALLMAIASFADVIDGQPLVTVVPFIFAFSMSTAVVFLTLRIYRKMYPKFSPEDS